MVSPGVAITETRSCVLQASRNKIMILCYFFFLAIYKQLINIKCCPYFDLCVFTCNFRVQWSTINSPQNSTDLQDTSDLALCFQHSLPPHSSPGKQLSLNAQYPGRGRDTLCDITRRHFLKQLSAKAAALLHFPYVWKGAKTWWSQEGSYIMHGVKSRKVWVPIVTSQSTNGQGVEF